ncbi:MAG: DUF58 domain-containing protein [Kineosporiaceae bacterium]
MAATPRAGRHPAPWATRQGVRRETLPAGAVLALAGTGLIAVGVHEHARYVLALGCLAVAAVLVNGLWGRALGVRARVGVPERAVAGEPVSVVVRLRPARRAGLPATLLSLSLSGNPDTALPPPPPRARPGAAATPEEAPAELALALPAMASGSESWLVLTARLHSRGPAGRAYATGVTSAPFGLVRHSWTIQADTTLLVWPAQRAPRRLPGGGPDGESRLIGVDRLGTLPHGVREYRPGDDRRSVHWRSSARRGSLVVVERERRTADDAVVLVLCPPRRARVDPHAAQLFADWEETVARAAWSLAAAASAGGTVVLAAAGRGDVQARPVRTHEEVLDWFALLPGALEAASSPVQALTAAGMPPGSGIGAPSFGGVPPDLGDAVAGLTPCARRGAQVLGRAAAAQPVEALTAASVALTSAGRRPVALREWLR